MNKKQLYTMAVRFSVNFMRLLLLSNFISQSPDYRNREKFAVGTTVAIAVLMLFGNLIGLMNLEKFADSGALMLFTTIILQNMATLCVMRIHRNDLKLYMERLEAPDITNMETNRLFRKLMQKVLTYFYICYTTALIGSLFNTMMNRDYENHMRYVVPFWFYCPTKNTSSLAVSRICLRTNTVFEYVNVNIFNFIVNIFLHIPYIMSIGFFLLILQFKKAHRHFIQHRIQDISTALIANSKSTRDDWRMKAIYEEFENVIRQYQWLHSVITSCLPVLGQIVGIHLVGSFSNFLLSAFIVLYNPQTAHSTVFRIQCGCSFLFLIPDFVFFCLAGQAIYDLNTRIGAAVYDLPWYEQTVQFQRLVYQFLLLLHQPIRIKTFNMYHIKVNFLRALSQRLYAGVNLMFVNMADVQF